MKNKFIIFGFAAVIALGACEKNIDTAIVESENSSTAKNEVDILSKQFLDSHRGSVDQDRRINWDRVKEIAAADCVGALGGMIAGSVVPVHGWWIGGILGGAGASLGASAPYNGGNPGFYNPAFEFSIAAIPGNGGNPYNYCGYYHYMNMNDHIVAVDGDVTDDLSSYYDHSTVVLSEGMEVDLVEVRSSFSLANCNETVASWAGAGNLSAAIVEMNDSGMLSTTVSGLLSSYSDVYQSVAFADIEDFVAYSIEVENAINADDSIELADKQYLLGAMATLRYGIQYWSLFSE